jgi:hypothetical protein
MTMLDVEHLFGPPDRVDVEPGKLEGDREHPKVIKWIDRKYRITDSGETFGRPGHVTFLPLRFTKAGWNDQEADRTAREYGEQSDSFRTYGFRGSFPVDGGDWETGGPFDAMPLKKLPK